MVRTILAAAAAGILGGCMTADDVRQRPADFTATYAAHWETVANCLQARFIDGGVVTPQYNQREKTAVLTVAIHGIVAPGPVVAEYRVRGIADEKTAVEYRERPSLFGSKATGREIADRCSRAV